MSPAQAPTIATQRIIWLAMLGSIALYAALPWIVRPEVKSSSDALLLSFMAIAILTGIGTLAARELLLVRPIRAGELRVATDAGLARLSQISIVLWALSESVALYGVILYVLSGEARHLYLFLMASAGLFFVHRPGRLPAPDRTTLS
jgi:hypothetical protein